MPNIDRSELDLILVEDTVWVLIKKINLPNYDFDLTQFFSCRRPWYRPEKVIAIGRFGAVTNYAELYQQLAIEGIFLVHSPAQYLLASELTHWYPILEGLTPKSLWFRAAPDFNSIAPVLGLPLFLKGSRQTSRHRAALSIIHSEQDYQTAIEVYREDPILQWQNLVCREFVKLRPVRSTPTEKIPASFEFRTFWWRGHCIGSGQYWSIDYDWNRAEEIAGLAIARAAALRLGLPFVVIDIAQTITGEWIAIECNDAQESSYGAISPFALWQNLIDIERKLASQSPI
jgi:ATP-grasp domain, R2K clade family 3